MEMDFGGGDTPHGHGDDAMDDVDLADDEILCFVRQLGACPKAYLREQRQGLRALVSEIYSPPRVTAMAHAMPSLRLVPGFALDITVTDEFDGMPWDFSTSDKRQRARTLLQQQKPMLLIGSPE